MIRESAGVPEATPVFEVSRPASYCFEIQIRDWPASAFGSSLDRLSAAPTSANNIGCNGGLPDIDAELEQFAMYSRCFPKPVPDTRFANELANSDQTPSGQYC
jgi:hypothetical protein